MCGKQTLGGLAHIGVRDVRAYSKVAMLKKVPVNGLAIYSGTTLSARGRDDHATFVVEPLTPIQTGLYRCGARFYTEVRRTGRANQWRCQDE